MRAERQRYYLDLARQLGFEPGQTLPKSRPSHYNGAANAGPGRPTPPRQKWQG